MSRLINADKVVHWQSYDDEHETFPEHEGTIAEFLDAMTDEGCPESVDTLSSALQEAIRRIEKKLDEVYGYPKTEYAEGYVNACKAAIKMLKSLSFVDAAPTVDAVSVVRCEKCVWMLWKWSDARTVKRMTEETLNHIQTAINAEIVELQENSDKHSRLIE